MELVNTCKQCCGSESAPLWEAGSASERISEAGYGFGSAAKVKNRIQIHIEIKIKEL
jgi:hypothetical protein